MIQTSPIDLDRYLDRIGFTGKVARNAETLHALHLAHTTHVPFENLDVLQGLPIRLDLPSLVDKMVDSRRGGYCFEQNGLFTAVLEFIGFRITRLSGRVRLFNRLMPRTHMVFLAEADGRQWLGDVGFGGWGLFEPIPLELDRPVQQHGWTFALRQEDNQYVLQCAECPIAVDQYAFTLEPHLPIDYEPANHYCATHPESRFVQTLTAQLPTLEGRYILRNREFITITPNGVNTEILENSAALLGVLKERFGIDLPEGCEFPKVFAAASE